MTKFWICVQSVFSLVFALAIVSITTDSFQAAAFLAASIAYRRVRWHQSEIGFVQVAFATRVETHLRLIRSRLPPIEPSILERVPHRDFREIATAGLSSLEDVFDGIEGLASNRTFGLWATGIVEGLLFLGLMMVILNG